MCGQRRAGGGSRPVVQGMCLKGESKDPEAALGSVVQYEPASSELLFSAVSRAALMSPLPGEES